MKTKEKAVKVVKNKPKKLKKDGLNINQELFCRLYATEAEFFGNGVQSYAVAYGIKLNKINYKSTQVCASQLLSIPMVISRIRDLLQIEGYNDENVDKQHLFLINQFEDLKTKMSAIKEYNVIKKRTESKPNESPITNQTINIIGQEALTDFIELYRSKVTDKHS
jgi:hypothetical protein